MALENLEVANFTPLIGGNFGLIADGQAVRLMLASAELAGRGRPGAAREPFSLTFRGAPGLRIPQGIRILENDVTGVLEIFLTQIADHPEGSQFEAVFS